MRRAMSSSRLAPLALAAAALLGSPLPSHAYRMLEGPSSGQTSGTQSAVLCNNDVGFAHWNTRSMGWYLNAANQGAGKATALEEALETWSTPNVSDASYQMVLLGGTTGGVARDFKNTFVWGTTSTADLCGTTACHAVTVLHLDSGRVIRDVDIVFNNTMDWRTDDSVTSTCTATAPGTPLDTQGIATHELGHALGIHHTQGSLAVEPARSATMGAQSCNVAGRSLTEDDKEALRCSEDRYPVSPAFEGYLEVANCDTISGWAWNANRPNRTSYVDLTSAGALVDVVAASSYRADLAAAGKGNGMHGFSLPTPSEYRNGTWKSVSAKFATTTTNMSFSPQAVACDVPLFSLSPGAQDYVPNNGTTYEMATQFSSSHNGRVTALMYYFPPNETVVSHTARLWSDSGTLLGQANLSPPSFGLAGWRTGSLSTPVAITAGVLYRVSITTYSVRSETACSSTQSKSLYHSITNGPLTAHRGYWGTSAGAFPNTSSCSNFWVGVEFDKT